VKRIGCVNGVWDRSRYRLGEGRRELEIIPAVGPDRGVAGFCRAGWLGLKSVKVQNRH
jgi:hypothetical protein